MENFQEVNEDLRGLLFPFHTILPLIFYIRNIQMVAKLVCT